MHNIRGGYVHKYTKWSENLPHQSREAVMGRAAHTNGGSQSALFAACILLAGWFGSEVAVVFAGESEPVPHTFISWQEATTQSDDPAQAYGPHANYTTSTTKCGVCHSVHTAPEDSWLLTAVDDSDTGGGRVCAYCHGIGGSILSKIVSIERTGTNFPHSAKCTGMNACHAESPHGLGVSEYPVLAKKLLNNNADALIATAIDDLKSAIDESTFAAENIDDGRALTMATGYLCSSSGACHSGAAFAVGNRGDHMMVYTGDTAHPTQGSSFRRTGHPVWAAARETWTPPPGSAFTSEAGSGAIAWVDAYGCASCHDVVDSRTDKPAFPHNTAVPSWSSEETTVVAGSPDDRLWMTKASDSSRKDVVKITSSVSQGESVVDGACIKCHISGDRAKGVGTTY